MIVAHIMGIPVEETIIQVVPVVAAFATPDGPSVIRWVNAPGRSRR